MSRLEAGALRHWVEFEELTVVQDSDGAQVEEWIPAFEVNSRMPAEVIALSGRELIAAQDIQSRVTTRIRVRYRPGFVPNLRAVLGDTVFNIEAVIPDADSRVWYLTLLCSSGTNQG